MRLVFCLVVLVTAVARSEELLTEHPTIKELHAETIRVREAVGIRSHPTLDEDCCRIAQRWANHMAATNSMYHGGGEQIIASGYHSVRDAIAAWRNSGGHWAWLGGGSQRCGFGYQRSSSGTCYWAGVFRGRVVVAEEGDDSVATYSSRSRLRWRATRR